MQDPNRTRAFSRSAVWLLCAAVLACSPAKKFGADAALAQPQYGDTGEDAPPAVDATAVVAVDAAPADQGAAAGDSTSADTGMAPDGGDADVAGPDVTDPNKGMPPGFSWQHIPPMHVARANASAVWGGGYFYVFGGQTKVDCCMNPNTQPANSDGLEASLERYDPQTKKWDLLPTPPVYPETGSRFVWGGDHLYVYATHDPNLNFTGPTPWADKPVTAAAYDLASGIWAELPAANSPGKRWSTTALWTGENLIIFGQHQGSKYTPGAAFDPQTASWTPLPTPPTPAAENDGWSHPVWNGNHAIYFGNKISLEYAPAAQTWTAFPRAPGAENNPGMSDYRRVAGAAPLQGGVLMLTKKNVGGFEFWIHKDGAQVFELVEIPKNTAPGVNASMLLANGTPCWVHDVDVISGGGACLEPTTATWMPIAKPVPDGGSDGAAWAAAPLGAARFGGFAAGPSSGSVYVAKDGWFLTMPKGGFQ